MGVADGVGGWQETGVNPAGGWEMLHVSMSVMGRAIPEEERHLSMCIWALSCWDKQQSGEGLLETAANGHAL